jgi:hypothetical protein
LRSLSIHNLGADSYLAQRPIFKTTIIMNVTSAAGAALIAGIVGAAAQACASAPAQEINGNWYCQAVSAITYSNFDAPGTYNKVTTMANGVCGSTPQSYGGTMAPMDEEV